MNQRIASANPGSGAPAAAGVSLHGVLSYPLQDGDPGTIETIMHIRRLVDAGMKNAAVNRTALEILNSADPRRVHGYDDARKIRAIFEWVLRHIGYVKDPPGKELLRPADVILQVRGGDCDDLNGVLLPSLLGSVGYATRLVTVSMNPAAPEEFSHIYCEVNLHGRWIPLDAARPKASWLKRPGRHFRKRIWSLLDDSYSDVAGLAGYNVMIPAPLPYGGRRNRRRVRGSVNGLGFDWAGFITPLTTGVTNIITAVKGGGNQFVPQAQGGANASPYQPPADYTTPLLIGGGLLAAVLLLKR